jgi:hypothetical protein
MPDLLKVVLSLTVRRDRKCILGERESLTNGAREALAVEMDGQPRRGMALTF